MYVCTKYIYFRNFYIDKANYLTLPGTLSQKVWKPDLFFSNEMEYRLHDGLSKNEYYRVYPNGEVLFSARCFK